MPRPDKFKVVLFDLGGTLIKTASVPEIYRRILQVYGVNVSLDAISKAHGENEKEFSLEKMVALQKGFWIRWNARVLERIGISGNREFLARKIDELWWDYADLKAEPDAVETVTQLKRKRIKVGVITNAFEGDYSKILQRLGWMDTFDVLVGIDACKRAKPNSEIFLYALNKLGINPQEVIFIGDSIKHDYEGAKKAGLKALLINREGKSLANVETITSLTEVLRYF